MSRIYLTTTLPYVNASPHIGFALEIIQADVIARHYRGLGHEVFFNFGTDEHGQKVYEKAIEERKTPQELCDYYAESFKKLTGLLNLSPTNFIRTTDEHHIMAAQEFWKRCLASGDIYKKNYQMKYCVGCELEKQDSDLVDGKCPLHSNRDIEFVDEENYFFRFSKYQNKLLEFYDSNPNFFVPSYRFNEVKAFVARGLQDFSISRLKSKLPWGIPVPGDDAHVYYVWFDALVNYISAIGWPDRMGEFNSWWPVIQFCGKDQGRQQGAIWQAMLMSVGLPQSKQIVMHGFITGGGGVKMSKSLGNVINPYDVVSEYGTDALRYFLLREITPFEDGDFTLERFKESYNSGLANGLGNLTSRILKMAESYSVVPVQTSEINNHEPLGGLKELVERYEFKAAMDLIWERIALVDSQIQGERPFVLFKTDPDRARSIVRNFLLELAGIANNLALFMPETSKKILDAIKINKMPAPLFLRLE